MPNRQQNYKDHARARKTFHAQKKRYYARTAFAENGWQPWTEEEIEIVVKHERTDREIANIIGRSVGAIQKKRCKESKTE